jgi:hypothetical protein
MPQMYHPHKVSLAEVAHHQQESNFDVKKFMGIFGLSSTKTSLQKSLHNFLEEKHNQFESSNLF